MKHVWRFDVAVELQVQGILLKQPKQWLMIKTKRLCYNRIPIGMESNILIENDSPNHEELILFWHAALELKLENMIIKQLTILAES